MTPERMHIDIAVCTFRRPELNRTLASLARLRTPDWLALSVLVIDNDETPSAEGVVRAFGQTTALPVRYVHCPASNISIARNGALHHAGARFLAFIDDDEEAPPDWIAALAGTRNDTGADVVLGPVRALYGPDAPGWMQSLDIHSTRPVEVGGIIRTGYSCNVLIDLESPAIGNSRFELSLGRSGGEDTAFFTQAFRRGARFALAEAAVLTEFVPRDRARFVWLAQRRFRSGQTHGRLLAEAGAGPVRLASIGLALLKTVYCAGHALIVLPHTAGRNAALLRGCLHAGTVTGLIGMRPIALYGHAATGAVH